VLHFHGMIAENEITVIFAAAGVGKSILAVQIAEEIALTRKVLYIDLELSDKQFQKRYTMGGAPHRFPSTLIRAVLDEDDPNVVDLEQCVISSIEAAASSGIQVVILDNLSYACRRSESSEESVLLMQTLKHISKSHGLTLIVVAHTPKRYFNSPLTRDDLAGSHKLMVAFDAAIAIGEVAENKRQRYIKQVKVRSAEMVYDTESVLLCELTDEDGWLHFGFIGTASEWELIKISDPRMMEVMSLHAQGSSLRDIADKTGISKSTVDRWIKSSSKSVPGVPTVPYVPGTGHPGQMGQRDNDDLPE
jgi:Predicted ATP-dependent serine protease